MDSLTKETRSTRRNIIQRQMNNVQKQLLRFTAAALIVMIAWSCKPNPQTGKTEWNIPSWVNDASVTAGFAAGTQAGLRLGINDDQKRQAMADLLQYIASQGQAFLTATGDNSPDALATFLNANIPQHIKTNFPELVSFAVPLLVTGYQEMWTKYGNDIAKLSPWMKDACAGINIGSANFATKH